MGSLQGIDFWERTDRLTRDIFFDIRLNWMQYQIVRGTLKTNKIVSKFVPVVNAKCTFCENYIENILHIFRECAKVAAPHSVMRCNF